MKQLQPVGHLCAIFVRLMVNWVIFNTNLMFMGAKAHHATHRVAKA